MAVAKSSPGKHKKQTASPKGARSTIKKPVKAAKVVQKAKKVVQKSLPKVTTKTSQKVPKKVDLKKTLIKASKATVKAPKPPQKPAKLLKEVKPAKVTKKIEKAPIMPAIPIQPVLAVKTKQAGRKKGSKSLHSGAGPTRAELQAMGESVCREVACENLATTVGYCRAHYIKNWKKIKRKELILKERKLNQYIEELVAKYPDKYIEAIRQDLENDKDFAKVIHDLDLDESIDDFDMDGENVDTLIDNIRRDFEDDGEGF